MFLEMLRAKPNIDVLHWCIKFYSAENIHHVSFLFHPHIDKQLIVFPLHKSTQFGGWITTLTNEVVL